MILDQRPPRGLKEITLEMKDGRLQLGLNIK